MSDYSEILKTITLLFEKYKTEDVLNLPKYSKWPEILLESDKDKFSIKTKSSIYDEYENDKWGTLHNQIVKNKAKSIKEIRNTFFGKEILPAKWMNNYFKLNGEQYSHIQSNLIAEVMRKYKPDNVIELGAGFGSMMLGVIGSNYFKGVGYYCGELTHSGRSLLKKIGLLNGIDLTVFENDFHQDVIAGIDLPEDAIIFTSLAICEVPGLGDDIIDKIISLKPKIVINLEATYPNNNTLIDLLIKKYIVHNDYNRVFQKSIDKYSKSGRIKLLYKHEHIIGRNPLRPASLFVWSPR
jgi:hypothetical protein